MNPRVPDVGPGAFVIQLVRRRFPVGETERYSDEYWERLRKECALHVTLGQVFFPFGLMVGAFFFPAIRGGFTGWDLGVAFGFGVALAFGYQLAVCALKGFRSTFRKMSDYSTMMYGIPWSVQFRIVYLPFLLIGGVCAIGRLSST
jgi:hypothetical protein